MKKTRILLVFDCGLGYGGVETTILGIVRNLSKYYTFDLLTNISVAKENDEEFEKFGGKILRIPFYEGSCNFRKRADYYIRGMYLYKESLKIIRENMPYKAIHCNNSYEGGIVLTAAKKIGIPIRIMHSHTVSNKENFIRDILNKIYKSLITKNMTCSISCSEYAANLYKNSVCNKVIYNFYDDSRFIYNPKMNVDKELKLIQVARYDDNKNQKFSLEVLSKIVKDFPHATLALVGEKNKEDTEVLSQIAKRLNILSNVKFYRSDADIPMLLNKSNIFIFPSISEGFGIALIEAQAVGLKCYASNTIPDITNCGGVRYLDLNEGAEYWAQEIIVDFLKHNTGKQHYDCSRFSIDSVMNQYIEIYEGN